MMDYASRWQSLDLPQTDRLLPVARRSAGSTVDSLHPRPRVAQLFEGGQHLWALPHAISHFYAALGDHRVDEALAEAILLHLEGKSGDPDEELFRGSAPRRPLLEALLDGRV